MKKIIILFVLFLSFYINRNAQAQCQAIFSVYQDTTLGAPPHTYIGENLCQGANFLGIDTINYTYTWTWGDGTSTVAPFPTHTYASTGNYTICVYMNATNPAGCNDSFCINATINKNAAMATINFKKPGVASFVKESDEKKLKIYPNPSQGILNIENFEQGAYISIYNIDGTIIYAQKSIGKSLYIANIAKGMYAIKINMVNGKTAIHKVIVE